MKNRRRGDVFVVPRACDTDNDDEHKTIGFGNMQFLSKNCNFLLFQSKTPIILTQLSTFVLNLSSMR